MPYCRELELMCKATAHTPYGDIEHDEFLANGLKCGSHTRLVSATWHIYAQIMAAWSLLSSFTAVIALISLSESSRTLIVSCSLKASIHVASTYSSLALLNTPGAGGI